MEFDFSGWATKNNIKCSDGRTIMKDAFAHNDGQIVPLVWNHQHNEPFNVLGHALLENRPEGVYTYCAFNDTESGQSAKGLVEHGDIVALSIYANQLKQQGGNVIHGAIREVSLVLAGANPGALIDSIITHGEEFGEEAVIYTGEDLVLEHADCQPKTEEPKSQNGNETEDKDETIGDIFESMTEDQKKVVLFIIGKAMESKKMKHSDKDDSFEDVVVTNDDDLEHAEGKTVKEIYDSLTDKQKRVVCFIVGDIVSDSDETKDTQNNENPEGGDNTMKHNVFENEEKNNEQVLAHDAMNAIIADGKRYGSLKESFLAHAGDYGIDNIDYLFPEAKAINNTPEFIKRDMGWVNDVMTSVHHTPFSRIKSVFADITEDEARAKGYIKGKLKKEEVFSLLKRTTTPTTIYKKQKIDRDDLVDITDFDVIAWLKSEMRMMLDEEIARAILIGDGRLSSSDDHINETNIRPVAFDDALYTVQKTVDVAAGADDDTKAKALIKAVKKSRKDYKGSGNPTFYTTEDVITDCLLVEDGMGHPMYDTVEKLATALRVKKIVAVPVMEGVTGKTEKPLLGVMVNLADYNVGADKGGAINMFDDFDIDYNQMKYLIETRCSGALVKPYSAIAFELNEASAG